MHYCKYCNKQFDNGNKLGGHVSGCNLNPNYQATLSKRKKSFEKKCKLNEIEKFGNFVEKEKNCFRCKNSFKIVEREKNNRKFCSRGCANTRNHSQETKNKIRLSLTKLKTIRQKRQKLKKNCLFCNSEIFGLNFCNKKCSGSYNRIKRIDKLSEKRKYYELCCFNFNVYNYPEEFNLDLIKKFGWYSAKNRGDNFDGVCRDHIYSKNEGFKNKIDYKIISHPANCKIIQNLDNLRKGSKSSITIEQLILNIENFNKKYMFP